MQLSFSWNALIPLFLNHKLAPQIYSFPYLQDILLLSKSTRFQLSTLIPHGLHHSPRRLFQQLRQRLLQGRHLIFFGVLSLLVWWLLTIIYNQQVIISVSYILFLAKKNVTWVSHMSLTHAPCFNVYLFNNHSCPRILLDRYYHMIWRKIIDI